MELINNGIYFKTHSCCIWRRSVTELVKCESCTISYELRLSPKAARLRTVLFFSLILMPAYRVHKGFFIPSGDFPWHSRLKKSLLLVVKNHMAWDWRDGLSSSQGWLPWQRTQVWGPMPHGSWRLSVTLVSGNLTSSHRQNTNAHKVKVNNTNSLSKLNCSSFFSFSAVPSTHSSVILVHRNKTNQAGRDCF